MTVHRKFLAGLLMVTLSCGLTAAVRADEPKLHDVYEAVEQNRLDQAQSMMSQVLRDHPDSAKAHYVEAEVLARMARTEEARSELARAESLAPGLPFAKAADVRVLRERIESRSAFRGGLGPTGLDAPVSSSRGAGVPWGLVGIVVLAGGVLMFLLLRNRRPVPMAGMPGTAVGPLGSPGGPYATPYPGTPYGGAPMGGGGIGSGIVGGLATGAALGAGMVAGEALAHDLMGGRERSGVVSDVPPADGSRVAYDDGDRDFGVSGADSWDSGGGGSDFGTDGGGGGDWS
jgi:hypothetical protein